jgi:hypothetical protein
MIRLIRLFFAVSLILGLNIRHVGAQADAGPQIELPQTGDALQGIVPISGSDQLVGRLYSEVAFAYAGDTTGTWFLIATVNEPVLDGTLTNWDTTTITDGNYILRLRVYLSNGTFRDVTTPNLRVRNYTPIETPTPAPTAVRPTLKPTITLTSTPFPTPTMLPPNQAILTPADVTVSIAYGGIAAIILLIIIGFYLWLRRK